MMIMLMWITVLINKHNYANSEVWVERRCKRRTEKKERNTAD